MQLWGLALFIVFTAALHFGELGVGGVLPEVVRIGVIYDQDRPSDEEKLLSQALDRANLNASYAGEQELSASGTRGPSEDVGGGPRTPHLSLSIVRLEEDNVFRSAKKVCQLLEQGVLAVLGPREPETASLVHSACARHHVPHVYLNRGDEVLQHVSADYVSLTIAPSPEELGRALRELVQAMGWKHFTVICERPGALVQLRGLLQVMPPGRPSPHVSLRLLPGTADPRPVLREVAEAGERNIVLDVAAQRLTDVLRQEGRRIQHGCFMQHMVTNTASCEDGHVEISW